MVVDEVNNCKVLQNDTVGRYAVASKKLNPGDVILTELPFVVGPKIDSVPICLGCYAFVDGSTLCSKCKWPVCGIDCENNIRHKNAECKVFSEANVSWQKSEEITLIDPQFDCITPLRMLLAKEEHPDQWSKNIDPMMSHCDQKKSFCEAEKVNVVQFLREKCKLKDKFDEHLIHQVCGILEVNAYEARTISDNMVRALYPQLAILSHSCVPNTAHSILSGPIPDPTQDFKVIVRATVHVEADGELLASYAYTLSPTILRQETLLETKYFKCSCKRCLDPTELESHLGTLKCTKCDNGLIMSTQPTDVTAIWKCTHCEFSTKGEAVRRALLTMQAELDGIDAVGFTPQGIEMREAFAKKYRSILHPLHSIQTSIRLTLIQMYGRVEGYTMEDLPDLLFERKVEMCEQILRVLDKVEPGYTRLRGLTLYELHAPLIFLAKNTYQAGIINTETLRKKLNEAASILEESATILCLEDPSSVEGALGVTAKQTLQEFRDNMENLINSL